MHLAPYVDPYKTTAGQVRTGMVVRSDWMRPHVSIEVDVVHHVQFTNWEGTSCHVIRFTGWELFNGHPVYDADGNRIKRIVRGGGQRPGDRMRVLADLRTPKYMPSDSYLSLTGRSDVDKLQAELDEFLAARAAV